MSQPVMGMGGGQWGGYQNMPGYVWGTPMAGASMDSSSSWQVRIHYKDKKRKDFTFWRQFNEQPSIILGCPIVRILTYVSEQLCQSVSCICVKCLWASIRSNMARKRRTAAA